MTSACFTHREVVNLVLQTHAHNKCPYYIACNYDWRTIFKVKATKLEFERSIKSCNMHFMFVFDKREKNTISLFYDINVNSQTYLHLTLSECRLDRLGIDPSTIARIHLRILLL